MPFQGWTLLEFPWILEVTGHFLTWQPINHHENGSSNHQLQKNHGKSPVFSVRSAFSHGFPMVFLPLWPQGVDTSAPLDPLDPSDPYWIKARWAKWPQHLPAASPGHKAWNSIRLIIGHNYNGMKWIMLFMAYIHIYAMKFHKPLYISSDIMEELRYYACVYIYIIGINIRDMME